jgi:ABC-type antimicrobial peptide transport system permease subunit
MIRKPLSECSSLAATGIYGVISYAVGLRTREVGIRMALGARQTSVVAMILRQGLLLAAAALAVSQFLAALLYEARRAARIDRLSALRE